MSRITVVLTFRPGRGKLLTPQLGRYSTFHVPKFVEIRISPMPIVKFINEKKEIEVPEGANLRNEAKKAGINLNCGVNGYLASANKIVNCHGIGACGTCRVNIVAGMENTNAVTLREKLRFKTPVVPDPVPCLAYIGNEETMRLACCVKVNGDVEVESSPELNLFGENFFS